jgi:hypothetical protein
VFDSMLDDRETFVKSDVTLQPFEVAFRERGLLPTMVTMLRLRQLRSENAVRAPQKSITPSTNLEGTLSANILIFVSAL